MQGTKRVNVCKKGSTLKRPVFVSSWEQLLTSGSAKLKIKQNAKKHVVLRNGRGEVVDSFERIQEDEVVYF